MNGQIFWNSSLHDQLLWSTLPVSGRSSKGLLFKELVNMTPCEMALRDNGVEQSCQTFKDAFYRDLSPHV